MSIIAAAILDLQNLTELTRGAGRGRGRKEKTPLHKGCEKETPPN